MTTRLILVRHSHTDESVEKRYTGFLDTSLNERGRDEAARTLRPVFESLTVEAAYSSDLKRAVETAAIALGARNGMPLVTDPALREIDCGAWEGMTFDEIVKQDEARYRHWIENVETAAPPGGETLDQLFRRVTGAMRRILDSERGKTAAVFTHGGPLSVMLCFVQQLPPAEIWNNFPPHASATEVVARDDGTFIWSKLAGW